MTANAERIAGAKECIAALDKLEQSARSLPETTNDGVVFSSIQSGDAESLASLFAPLTPRGGSANPDTRLSEISASMGDGNRLPRSRSNEKTPP